MISGVVNVYKEAGFTSHDAVAKLRGILHQKKIGHTGTLDPDAVGVLPVCLGKATKLVDTLASDTKTYETVLLLGRETDTQDISGQILKENEVTCSEEDVRKCLAGFLGEQEQIPPMYSAKKQNGKRLYQLAREGVTVERRPALIRIDELEMLSCELPRVSMRITCSKGTYIRTLCHDIGQALGCGGCMEQLVRTRAGRFEIQNALTLGEIEERVRAGRLREILMGIDSFFADLPALSVPKDRFASEADRLLHNGNLLQARNFSAEDMQDVTDQSEGRRVRVYDSEDIFMGVYKYKPESGAYSPELFVYEPADNVKPGNNQE